MRDVITSYFVVMQSADCAVPSSRSGVMSKRLNWSSKFFYSLTTPTF